MIYRTLGRTGLKVSLLGMGTGGHDPLGVNSARPESEMVALLHRAFDLGIRLFDTSPGYGSGHSEHLLGRALGSLPRDQLVVTTKIALAGSMPNGQVSIMKPPEVAPAVEDSLRRLNMDYVDVMLIAVADQPEHFDMVIEELIPELEKVKRQGKIRFLGSSEQTVTDGAHLWLQRILPTDRIDVAMVGHNMINQSARHSVFPLCKEKNIGVINVFTVRNLFCNPPRLKEVLSDLKQRKILGQDAIPDDDPLGWLLDLARSHFWLRMSFLCHATPTRRSLAYSETLCPRHRPTRSYTGHFLHWWNSPCPPPMTPSLLPPPHAHAE